MKWKYKSLIFLILILFCVGSVCATEPDNTTTTTVNNGNISVNDYNTMRACIDRLEANDVNQTNMINELSNAVNNQAIIINDLNNTINNQSVRISDLEQSNKELNTTVNELKADNKALNSKVDNQSVIINELNNTVNNQSVIINELNNKLDIQLNEINKLQAEKDKLNAEKCSIYERLLESPKKEDFEKLKKEIKDKNKQIEKLNNEIKTLKAINSVSKKDVVNSLKALSSTNNYTTIKCGKYTFKLEDYLKIPLIKDGKNRVIKYKKNHGELPNYVTIEKYKVYPKVYKKLFNIK